MASGGPVRAGSSGDSGAAALWCAHGSAPRARVRDREVRRRPGRERPEVMRRPGARQARAVAAVGRVLACVAAVPTIEEAGMWVSIEYCVV